MIRQGAKEPLIGMENLQSPVADWWEDAPRSQLSMVVTSAQELVAEYPEVLEWIDRDLDEHGKRKKLLRQKDKEWRRAQSQGQLGLSLGEQEPLTIDKLTLAGGRERTAPEWVVIGLVWQSLTGGFKSHSAKLLLEESRTLRVLAHQLSTSGKIPKASTLWELISAVKPETIDRIVKRQVSWVAHRDNQPFEQICADSTAVSSSSAWPVESDLILKVVQRLVRLLTQAQPLWRRGGNAHRQARSLRRYLTTVRKVVRQLNLRPRAAKGSKALRREDYRILLQWARRVKRTVQSLLLRWTKGLASLKQPPSVIEAQRKRWAQAQQDLQSLIQLIDQTHKRVIEANKVAAADKVLSVSDPSASLILKGDRQPTLGYKPQLARDARGFVVALLVPEGNASDSAMMQPLFEKTLDNTGIIPNVWSVDDGYTSANNYQYLREKQVEVPSFSGSKANKLIGDSRYHTQSMLRARMSRSRVESTMHQLKSTVHFGKLSRRAIRAVTAELLAKVFTMNLLLRARLAAT